MPIGLTLIEMTEEVLLRYVSGRHVREADDVPRKPSRYGVDRTPDQVNRRAFQPVDGPEMGRSSSLDRTPLFRVEISGGHVNGFDPVISRTANLHAVPQASVEDLFDQLD